jgi:hypothetical protein
MSMERKTIIVNTTATEQPHFASSKKFKVKSLFVVSLVISYVKMITSVNTF